MFLTQSRHVRQVATPVILVVVVSVLGSCSNDASSRRALALPTAPSSLSLNESSGDGIAGTADSPFRIVVDQELRSDTLAAFPPRNEPLQFRQALESYYQNTLHR